MRQFIFFLCLAQASLCFAATQEQKDQSPPPPTAEAVQDTSETQTIVLDDEALASAETGSETSSVQGEDMPKEERKSAGDTLVGMGVGAVLGIAAGIVLVVLFIAAVN